MNDFLTQFLSNWFDLFWRVTWQGTIVILLALLVDFQWKTMPPVWRNWLWRLAFLKIAVAVLPLSIPLPLLPASAAPNTVVATSTYVDVSLAGTPLDTSQSSISPWKFVLFSVWLIGFLACAISNWESGRQVRNKLRNSTSTRQGSLLMQSVRAISRQLGLTVIPEVRLAPGSNSPCLLTRKKRSIILLPQQWLESCSISELRFALAHELAHLARGDLAWNRFLVWSRAVLFFHPLVWIAVRRYLLSQEIACDSIAIAKTGGQRADFACLLVQLAEHATATPIGAVAMIGSSSTLKERIASMYRTHYKPAKFVAWVVTAIGVLSLMPFAIAQRTGKDAGEQVKVNQDAGVPNISVSASATSRGSGFADGMGAGGGMGRGNSDGGDSRGLGFGSSMSRSRSRSSGKTSISISTNPSSGGRKRSTRSQAKLEKPSRMKQSMISQNTDGQESWTRTTEATLKGDNITIVEKPNSIAFTIEHPEGAKEVFVANDLKDLASQSRTAAAIYRKLMNPASTASNRTGTTSKIGNIKHLDARDLLKEHLQSMKDGQGPQDAMLDRLLDELDALD